MWLGRSLVGLALSIGLLGMGYVELAIAVPIAQAQASELDRAYNEGKRLFREGSKESLEKSIAWFEKVLEMTRSLKLKEEQALSLLSLGRVYDDLGEKQKALEFYNQALTLRRAIGDSPEERLRQRGGEATTLNNIGRVYSALGEKQKALEFYNQALPLYHGMSDWEGEATTLNNIGRVYDDLGEKQKALEFYNQALPLRRAVGDQGGEAVTLNNIGGIYEDLGEKQKALEFYNQALILRHAVGDRGGEAATLNNIARFYDALGEKQKALEFYNRALPLVRAVGNRVGEATTLNNIGFLIKSQQPQVAIAFYKQSINIYEFLRTQIDTLPRSTQERYTRTVSKVYRHLANLLIQQNRLSEAQQVLELLKLREIKELKPSQSDSQKLIRQIPISDTEKQSIAQISPETAKDITPTALPQIDRLSSNPLNQSAQNLLNSQPNSSLIYHLITENQLWIILATPDGKLQRFSSNIKQKDLEAIVQEFRDQIQQCERQTCGKSDTQTFNTISQKLYQQIFPPNLQTALQKANIKHLTFALDGSLRNIPIAALHTGTQYLIEQYSISNIIAAQLTDNQSKLPKQFPILAAGTSNQTTVPLPDYVRWEKADNFPALGGVELELAAIVGDRGVFSGLSLLNQEFTKSNLQKHIPNYPIVHIATHGIFRPNFLNYSYLLLGNGQPWTMTQIDTENPNLFRNTHLLTLSACQTGLGDKDNTGMEIAGISHAFMSQGAKSIIASLWSVEDRSTALTMQKFYKTLATGQFTKAQALQKAQLEMLNIKDEAARKRAIASLPRTLVVKPIGHTQESKGPPDYSHPYHWSPFVLIGNSR
jgi:CHAT domain-containing protein/Tfp pilus assembly protein PilF